MRFAGCAGAGSRDRSGTPRNTKRRDEKRLNLRQEIFFKDGECKIKVQLLCHLFCLRFIDLRPADVEKKDVRNTVVRNFYPMKLLRHNLCRVAACSMLHAIYRVA
jgi:hypothetical protein